MKKDTRFREVLFSEQDYQSALQKYMEIAEKLPDLLVSLKAEGLPTTFDFIQMITDTDDSFAEYISEITKKRLGDTYIPIEERKRIMEIYNDVHDRVKDDVSRLRQLRKENFPLIADGDSISTDIVKVQEMARDRATVHVNNGKMTEYYDAVEKVKKAMDDLHTFEANNGLPSFIEQELQRAHGTGVARMNFDSFYQAGGDADTFAFIAQDYFRVK